MSDSSPREESAERMIGARHLLQDLHNRVVRTSQFQRRLERIVHDPTAFDELLRELSRATPVEDPAF